MLASLLLVALAGAASAAPVNLNARALPTPVSTATAKTYLSERELYARHHHIPRLTLRLTSHRRR